MKTVVAALLLQDDRLLICQRRNDGPFPGKWEFPGGKLEPEETPHSALQRELQEELGIASEIGAEVWRVEHQYPGHDRIALQFFEVSSYKGSIENRVFQKICWSPLQNLSGFDFLDADRALVQRLTNGEILIRPAVYCATAG